MGKHRYLSIFVVTVLPFHGWLGDKREKTGFLPLHLTSILSQLQHRGVPSRSCEGQYFCIQKGCALYSISPTEFVGICRRNRKKELSVYDVVILIQKQKYIAGVSTPLLIM